MKVQHSFKEAYDFFPHFTSSQNLPLYTQQCWRIPGQQHCKFKQHLKMQEEAIGLTTLLGHSMRIIFPHQTQKYFMLDQNTLTQKYSWLQKQTYSQQCSHILPYQVSQPLCTQIREIHFSDNPERISCKLVYFSIFNKNEIKCVFLKVALWIQFMS